MFCFSAGATELELLRCVSELKSILADKPTDLFYSNGLALGARGNILFVATERDIYAFPLNRTQYSSLRLEIPSPDPRRENVSFFIRFFHSEVYGSRLSEMSVDKPALPHKITDYQMAQPMPLDENVKKRNLSLLIQDDLSEINGRFQRGTLTRMDLMAGNLSLCRGSAFGDQGIGKSLNQKITDLELVSRESIRPTRAPASYK